MTIAIWKFIAKHVTIKRCLTFNKEDLAETMDLMANGKERVLLRSDKCEIADTHVGKLKGYKKMFTSRIVVDDIVQDGFEELVNNKQKHVKVLVSPRGLSLLADVCVAAFQAGASNARGNRRAVLEWWAQACVFEILQRRNLLCLHLVRESRI